MIDINKLKQLLAAYTADRKSTVENSPELAAEAVNALPELLAIAEAACAIRDSGIVVGDSPYASAPVELMTALIAVVGAARKAGS